MTFKTPNIFLWSAPEPCSPVGKWLDGPLPKDTQIPHTPPNIAEGGQDFWCMIIITLDWSMVIPEARSETRDVGLSVLRHGLS